MLRCEHSAPIVRLPLGRISASSGTAGQLAETDQIRRLHQTLLHQVDQPGPAGQDLGVFAVLFEQG